MSVERTWAKAEDRRARDGARFIRLVDAGGKPIYVIEVMELQLSLEHQARTVAAIVALLNGAEVVDGAPRR